MTFDTAKAKIFQEKFSSHVRLEPGLLEDAEFIAGLDVAYDGGYSFGAAALVERRSLRVLDRSISTTVTRIPYMPGLLAFREAGPMISALLKLKGRFDAVMVNGHGMAHPRRFGIACHVGVALDIRSVGVAKKRLVGVEEDDRLYLDGDEVARILKNGKLKLYVSVGHRSTLDEAEELVSEMLEGKGLLPKPLQEAHNTATRASRSR